MKLAYFNLKCDPLCETPKASLRSLRELNLFIIFALKGRLIQVSNESH